MNIRIVALLNTQSSILYLVNFLHDPFRLLKDVDDSLVVLHILEAQGQTLAVFEPLLSGLVATNVEVPSGFWHSLEILLTIDIDTILLPAIAVHL